LAGVGRGLTGVRAIRLGRPGLGVLVILRCLAGGFIAGLG
jgi:hypothetical protein